LGRSTLLPSAGLDTGSSIRLPSDADLGLDSNSAAALVDKLLDLAGTETRTLPNRLRREIGVERLPKHIVRHDAPVSATMISTTPVDAPGRGTPFFAEIATSPPSCGVALALRHGEREVKVLWISHKIGEISGNLGVK
jgi:hypothetical protein